MHCRQCGYALWNLPEPRCPECGAEFDLASYHFQKQTVAFACPHCGHQHPGEGPNYQPALAADNHCAGCGVVLDSHKLRVVPLVDDVEAIDAVDADAIPWEDRARTKRWKAWWATWRMVVARPDELGGKLSPQSDWSLAVRFAWWLYLWATLGTVALATIFVGGLELLFIGSGSGAPTRTHGLMASAAVFLAQVVGVCVMLGMVFPALAIAILTVWAHGCLRLTGELRGGWKLTSKALLYSQAVCLLAAVPVCGWHMHWICLLVALVEAVVILRKAQGVSTGRAFLAVGPGFLLVAVLFLVWLLLMTR